ncbi:MAG: HD domain-containing protein, partial [Clostridia bacterium]|nr:HD domain-containing protein [Clostridia bacterium]
MSHSFFAMFSRMKYIDRWALMRNTRKENLCEHSLEVAAIAHALAVIANERCGASLNTERAALLGIYHDMPEIITGDMP